MSSVSSSADSVWNNEVKPSQFWYGKGENSPMSASETQGSMLSQNAPVRPMIVHTPEVAGNLPSQSINPPQHITPSQIMEQPVFYSISGHHIAADVISERRSLNNPFLSPDQRAMHPFSRAEFIMLTEPVITRESFAGRQAAIVHHQREMSGGQLDQHIEKVIASDQRREMRIFSEWEKWHENLMPIDRSNLEASGTTFQSVSQFLFEVQALSELQRPLHVGDLKKMIGVAEAASEPVVKDNQKETLQETEEDMFDRAVMMVDLIKENQQDPNYKEIRYALLQGKLETKEHTEKFLQDRWVNISDTVSRYTSDEAMQKYITDHFIFGFQKYIPLIENYHEYKEQGLSALNYLDTVAAEDKEFTQKILNKEDVPAHNDDAIPASPDSTNALIRFIEEKIGELNIQTEENPLSPAVEASSPAAKVLVKPKQKTVFKKLSLQEFLGDIEHAVFRDQEERMSTHFSADIMKAVSNTTLIKNIHNILSNNPRINAASFSEEIKKKLSVTYNGSTAKTSIEFAHDYKLAHNVYAAWSRKVYLSRYAALDEKKIKAQYAIFKQELEEAHLIYKAEITDLERQQQLRQGPSQYTKAAFEKTELLQQITDIITSNPRISSSDYSKRINDVLRKLYPAQNPGAYLLKQKKDNYRSALSIFQSWNKNIYFKHSGNKSNDELRKGFELFFKDLKTAVERSVQDDNNAEKAAERATEDTNPQKIYIEIDPEIIAMRSLPENFRIFRSVQSVMKQKRSAQDIDPALLSGEALKNMSDVAPADRDLAQSIMSNWKSWHYSQPELVDFSAKYGVEQSIQDYFSRVNDSAVKLMTVADIPLPQNLLEINPEKYVASRYDSIESVMEHTRDLAPFQNDMKYVVGLQDNLDEKMYQHVINNIQFELLSEHQDVAAFLTTLREKFLDGQTHALGRLHSGDFEQDTAREISLSHIETLTRFENGVKDILRHYHEWIKENPGKSGRDYARALKDAGADIHVIPENWPALPAYRNVPSMLSPQVSPMKFVEVLKKDLEQHKRANEQANTANPDAKTSKKSIEKKKNKEKTPKVSAVALSSASSVTEKEKQPALTQEQVEEALFKKQIDTAIEDSVRNSFDDIVFSTQRFGFTYRNLYALPVQKTDNTRIKSGKKVQKSKGKEPAKKTDIATLDDIVPLTDKEKISLLLSHIPLDTRQFANDNKKIMGLFLDKLRKDNAVIEQDPQAYRNAEIKKANTLLQRNTGSILNLKKMRYHASNFLKLYDAYIAAKNDPRISLDVNKFIDAVNKENKRYSELDETYKIPVALQRTDIRDMFSRIGSEVHQFYLDGKTMSISLPEEFDKLSLYDTDINYSLKQRKKELLNEFAKDEGRSLIKKINKSGDVQVLKHVISEQQYEDFVKEFNIGDIDGMIGIGKARADRKNEEKPGSNLTRTANKFRQQATGYLDSFLETSQKKLIVDQGLLNIIEHIQSEFPGTLVREIKQVFSEEEMASLLPDDAVISYQAARDLFTSFGNNVHSKLQTVNSPKGVATAVEDFVFSTHEFIKKNNFSPEIVEKIESDIAHFQNVMKQYPVMKEYFPRIRLQDFLLYIQKLPDVPPANHNLSLEAA